MVALATRLFGFIATLGDPALYTPPLGIAVNIGSVWCNNQGTIVAGFAASILPVGATLGDEHYFMGDSSGIRLERIAVDEKLVLGPFSLREGETLRFDVLFGTLQFTLFGEHV